MGCHGVFQFPPVKSVQIRKKQTLFGKHLRKSTAKQHQNSKRHNTPPSKH